MKNNRIIFALLIIVFIMGIGYATFASHLSITGSSKADISWNIHFDESMTNSYDIITGSLESGNGVKPSAGDIVYGDNGLSATISPKLNQPGDRITYHFRIINDGSLSAKLSDGYPLLIIDGKSLPSNTLSYTSGRINFSMTRLDDFIESRSVKGPGKSDFSVTVCYPENGLTSDAESHSFKILLNYVQE